MCARILGYLLKNFCFVYNHKFGQRLINAMNMNFLQKEIDQNEPKEEN